MLFSNNYKSISVSSEANIKLKGSKFYAFAFPLNSEEEFKVHLQKLKSEYPDATHHCFALVLNPDQSFQKSSDDGEPSNTAGKPILRAIIAKNLTNIGVVVVRYFGGIMLGVPGLILAYNQASSMALDQAIIIETAIEDQYELECEFVNEGEAHRFIKKLDARIKEIKYEEMINIHFYLKRENVIKLNDLQNEFYFLKVTAK